MGAEVSGWWQLKKFLFSPRNLGKIPILTNNFSKGLKPPTRFNFLMWGRWQKKTTKNDIPQISQTQISQKCCLSQYLFKDPLMFFPSAVFDITAGWSSDIFWMLGTVTVPHQWWRTTILHVTVDGSPAPVDMVNIPLFTGFHTCQVVQDFFHQQYFMYFSIYYISVKSRWAMKKN